MTKCIFIFSDPKYNHFGILNNHLRPRVSNTIVKVLALSLGYDIKVLFNSFFDFYWLSD